MKRENWYHDKWYRTRYVWKKNDILIKDINQDMYEKLIHDIWYVWQRENWYDKQYETTYI